MVQVKIYLKGRVLVFETTDGIYEERNAWEVEPKQTGSDSGVYKFEAREIPVLQRPFKIGNILKENGDAYTAQEFSDFIYQDTAPFFFESVNIAKSDLTITDIQRSLQLGGSGLSSDNFTIKAADGVPALTINGKRTVTLNTQVTGSAGFSVYAAGVLAQLVNQTGTIFPKPVKTNNITTEDSALSGTGLGLLISSGFGGSGTWNYQPTTGAVQLKKSTSETIPSANADGFSYYPKETGGVKHVTFINSNGDSIDLRKQDLPASPTNAEIATFLSNIGLANLI